MSVEAAATALGFNRCYISRLLSSCFGTGFNEFVNFFGWIRREQWRREETHRYRI